jgi:glutamate-5-semialdehyde dehydrogenase
MTKEEAGGDKRLHPQSVEEIVRRAQQASKVIACADTQTKNTVLIRMGTLLEEHCNDIIEANKQDLEAARKQGIGQKVLDRLIFNRKKVQSRIDALMRIVSLPDPIGQILQLQKAANGLMFGRMRVPLGVILMIYEARPHVTVNAGALCLKSGNAVLLRGGSEAKRCNTLLGNLWRKSLSEANLPPEIVQVVACSHEEVDILLQMDNYIDLVIPRGGKELIKAVSHRSRIPVIKHFAGVCHVYLDEGSDIGRGIQIALDSKCLMPEVCNAMETLLVCQTLLPELPRIVDAFWECGVIVRGCEKTQAVVSDVDPATDEDWRTEYLDNICSVRVVENVDEAIEHINRYGSHHTDTIVTDSESRARKFIQEVDSAVVITNASTMFCDGKSLGMGTEIGISTDKLHARGPMGLEELTSYKFVILGEGHIMGNQQVLERNSNRV